MRRICVVASVVVGTLACSCRSGPARDAQADAGAAESAAQSAPPDAGLPGDAGTLAAGGSLVASLHATMDKLRPLHRPLGKPKPGEWLAEHHERGQTFDAYRASNPIVLDTQRRVLYVQPLGNLTATQRRVITRTADYMARFFNLEVRTSEDLPLSLIPTRARRVHPTWGDKQILTEYVLDRLLKPRLPDDAAALIALTTSDLWPGEGWNFVFGQASLSDRVGVWSLYRYGDPAKSPSSFRLALLRTLKVAVHETGHMFSMEHCTAYECVMGGVNSLEELDRSPLWLCPECLAKIIWATQADPIARYRRLAELCKAEGLAEEEAFFIKEIQTLEDR